MAHLIEKVCFMADVPAPNGKFQRTLETNSTTKITRDGDTLVVEALIPMHGDASQLEKVVYDYCWHQVVWAKRAPVVAAPVAEPVKTAPPAKK